MRTSWASRVRNSSVSALLLIDECMIAACRKMLSASWRDLACPRFKKRTCQGCKLDWDFHKVDRSHANFKFGCFTYHGIARTREKSAWWQRRQRLQRVPGVLEFAEQVPELAEPTKHGPLVRTAVDLDLKHREREEPVVQPQKERNKSQMLGQGTPTTRSRIVPT